VVWEGRIPGRRSQPSEIRFLRRVLCNGLALKSLGTLLEYLITDWRFRHICENLRFAIYVGSSPVCRRVRMWGGCSGGSVQWVTVASPPRLTNSSSWHNFKPHYYHIRNFIIFYSPV
jgi:hypothetical protein